MKKFGKKIPTIIGLSVLVFGIAAGILLIQQRQIFHLGATANNQPKDVRITNIGDDSFTVSWTTDEKTVGSINWGEADSLNKTEADEIRDLSYTHSVTVRGLTASTNYSFKISSGETSYDNNGTPWQISTGPALAKAQTSTKTASGTVLTSIGTPATNALVYISIGGVSPLSTIVSENGSWVLPLSSARTTDLSSFYEIDTDVDVLEISVQAGADGIASAQIFAHSANPVPPIILGQVHDFKNLPPSQKEDAPNANLEIPTESTKSSRFSVEEIATPTAQTVTLKSVDEGETITSTKPEFFGEAPPGTKITITVESENPQGAIISVPSDGDWEWSPPLDLSPGTHKVTLTWKDANGILQTITKTFIVQAAEGPAFVSTHSASATAKSTSTPKATSSASASATARAKVTSTATATAIPESGTFTPTILLVIMGMGLVTFAISIGYLAFIQKE